MNKVQPPVPNHHTVFPNTLSGPHPKRTPFPNPHTLSPFLNPQAWASTPPYQEPQNLDRNIIHPGQSVINVLHYIRQQLYNYPFFLTHSPPNETSVQRKRDHGSLCPLCSPICTPISLHPLKAER